MGANFQGATTLLPTWINFNPRLPAWISNHMHSEKWDGITNSPTSTVQPFKFGNGWVISSHILQGMWLLTHTGIKFMLAIKGPQSLWACNHSGFQCWHGSLQCLHTTIYGQVRSKHCFFLSWFSRHHFLPATVISVEDTHISSFPATPLLHVCSQRHYMKSKKIKTPPTKLLHFDYSGKCKNYIFCHCQLS